MSTADRPPGCTYVGLDLSQAELERAPAGSYDQMLVGDARDRLSELEGRFDAVVSWQVLEHVKSLGAALENIRSYLRPGGIFVGQLSGTFALFGLANRAIPHRTAAHAMKYLLHRDPSSVFPAYYDKCWFTALEALGQSWTGFSVYPRYAGASYLSFSPVLQRIYLAYEEWTIRTERRNLATHYLIVGRR